MTLAGIPFVVLLVGATLILVILIKSGMDAMRAPPLVGYITLGLALVLLNSRWEIISGEVNAIFEFLAHIGVIFLLFRVGIESDLPTLRRRLGEASYIWIGNIAISAAIGYTAAYYLLGLGPIPSVVVALALTATSVGVSVGVWQAKGAIKSRNGERLIDVAGMDDISAVVLMALLFAVLPVLHRGGDATWVGMAAETIGLFALKIAGFGALCFALARCERRIVSFFSSLEPSPHPMLLVVGAGLTVAALAGLLDFSVAIGAFFAGLVFSSDPRSEKIDATLDSLYELFTPFFFIGVGMRLSADSLTGAIGPGLVLAAAAIAGKFVGTGGATLLIAGWRDAVLLGLSMVPRAEIAMIVMQRGLRLGDWATPPRVFSSMVAVCAITSLAAPVALRGLLDRWPQSERSEA